ncbi:MAG: hypothetical protein R3C30_01295 [Hyphomonadaceae bacterium]
MNVPGDYGYFKRMSLRDYWKRDYQQVVRWSLARAIRNTLEEHGSERDAAERSTRAILSAAYSFATGCKSSAEDPKLKSKLKEVASALTLVAKMDAHVDRLIRMQLFSDDGFTLQPLTFSAIDERPPLIELIATANIPAYTRMIDGAQRVHKRVNELANAYRRKPGKKGDTARYEFFSEIIWQWKAAAPDWPIDWEADTAVEDAKAPRGTPRPARATAPLFKIAQLLIAEISAQTGETPSSAVSSKVFTKALRDLKNAEPGPLSPIGVDPRKQNKKSKKPTKKRRK